MLVSSCNKCRNNDPQNIESNESLSFNIKNINGTSVFSNNFSLANLMIIENGDSVSYTIDETDSTITFHPNAMESDFVESRYNTTYEETSYIYLNDSLVFDLKFVLNPVWEKDCSLIEYRLVNVFFDSNLIINAQNTTCVSCSKIVQIII